MEYRALKYSGLVEWLQPFSKYPMVLVIIRTCILLVSRIFPRENTFETRKILARNPQNN